jgi:hypothetical protein
MGETVMGIESDELLVMSSRREAAKRCGVGVILCAGGAVGALVAPIAFPPVLARAAQGILWLCTLVVLAMVVYGLRFLKSRPLLALGAEGLVDRSSVAAIGFLAWNEVAGVRRDAERRAGRFLIIEATNPTRVIQRQSSRLKRAALRYNVRHGFGVVAIAEGMLALPAEEVEATIERMAGLGLRTRRRHRRT